MPVTSINFSAKNQNHNIPTRTMTKVIPQPSCDAVSFSAAAKKPKIINGINIDEILKDVFGVKRVEGPTYNFKFPDGESIEIPITNKKGNEIEIISYKKDQKSKVWISKEKELEIKTVVTRFSEGHPEFPQGGYERIRQDLKTGHNLDSVVQVNGKHRIYKTWDPNTQSLVSALTKNLDINDKSNIKSVLEEFEPHSHRVKSRLTTHNDGSSVSTKYTNGLMTYETVKDANGKIISQH